MEVITQYKWYLTLGNILYVVLFRENLYFNNLNTKYFKEINLNYLKY